MEKEKLLELRKNVMKFNKLKECIHPLLIRVMSSKTTGNLNVKGSFPTNETCLIVANHLCIEDIPTLGQAVKEHFYLLVSDEDKNTIDGLALMLNGVQWVHRLDKESRINSSNNAVDILKSGKSFAMYPEATWNLSPNQLMLPMNYGCIRMALEANVPIIPVVSFFDDEQRQTIIGDKFYPNENLGESIEELRDIMATMFFEHIYDYYKRNENKESIVVIEENGRKEYFQKRSEIDLDYWDKKIFERYNQYERARKDMEGVREFESQFIFTPKTDDYSYFQIFNSVIKETDDGIMVKRISSESNGLNGDEASYKSFFDYGYNEKVLKLGIKK